ncbi:MAG: 30S ribosomal protein S12 methylthiotransferase RimO [Clostridiaceae bacterium]|nr:30S ribosomal protein S12 methylthiotransferase RimO [Clostridiaceae bacterium]
MAEKIFLISLGCAKNLVNSEQMLSILDREGYTIVNTPEECDIAIVNTCGFIDSAKSEAIDVILKLAGLKSDGVIKGLIVAGCLTQRYKDEFLKELPEVDAALGTGSYNDIAEAVRAVSEGNGGEWYKPSSACDFSGRRHLLTPPYYAYLRIAEGCDNRCAYCVIPYIRGPYRSREMNSLIDEAKTLAAQGAKELLIIAQDITRYGVDLYGERMLYKLLEELCRIDGIEWIRLHYMYPDEIDDRLLETIRDNEKILKYFDLPLQHINDKVLKEMNRRGSGALIKERITKIRQMMPQGVFRTSMIVGFPGETEEEFQELYDFLAEYKLERAGFFCYSQEEGAPSAKREDQIPENIKEKRRIKLFELQERIMDEVSSELIGKTLEVLCCGYDESGRQYGRSYMDSVDVDGVVFFDDDRVKEGEFVTIKIIDAVASELYGETVK